MASAEELDSTYMDEEEEISSQRPNRRKVKHLFVNPRYQLKYVNWFISGAFVFLVCTVMAVHYRLAQVDHLLNSEDALAGGGHLPVFDAFSDITIYALAGLVAFTIYAVVLSLLINQRIAGPMVAIVDCIDQLRIGNYDYNRSLREKDELKPIYDAVQSLQQTLKNAQPKIPDLASGIDDKTSNDETT